MLDSDLFEILAPVILEADVLFTFRVKFTHDVVESLLEALLEYVVVFVSSTDDCLVVKRVLHFNLAGDLILEFSFCFTLGCTLNTANAGSTLDALSIAI